MAWKIDRIIPKNCGGADTLVNRVLCFKSANIGKNNKTPQEWLNDVDFGKLQQRPGHHKKEKGEVLHLVLREIPMLKW